MARRVLLALVAGSLLLAACGGGGNDDGALNGPDKGGNATAGPIVTVESAAGPSTKNVGIQGSDAPLSWLVEFPELRSGSKATTINTALRQVEEHEIDQWKASATGKDTSLSCETDTLLDTVQLFSVATTCTSSTKRATIIDATFDQASGARLPLSQLLTGSYLKTMSSEAALQLTIGGETTAAADAATPATAAAFADWGIESDAIDVVFTLSGGSKAVSFPLNALSAYVRPSGFLHRSTS